MTNSQTCNIALGTIPLRGRLHLERQKNPERFDVIRSSSIFLYVRGTRQVQLIRKAWEEYGRTGTTLQPISGEWSVGVWPIGVRWNARQTCIRMELRQIGDLEKPLA